MLLNMLFTLTPAKALASELLYILPI